MKHVKEYLPFDKDNYRNFFQSNYEIKLGSVSFEESKIIFEAISKVSKKIIKGLIKIIDFDPSLGTPKDIFPNHGRWEDNFKTMFLNRKVIDLDKDEANHLIIHEIGHAYDHKLGEISKTKEWLELSGWTENPPALNIKQKSDPHFVKHGAFERLKIQDDNLYSISNWWFLKGTGFVRWYAKRNPSEDFAECFSFYVLKEKDKFEDCMDKYEYIEKILILK